MKLVVCDEPNEGRLFMDIPAELMGDGTKREKVELFSLSADGTVTVSSCFCDEADVLDATLSELSFLSPSLLEDESVSLR